MVRRAVVAAGLLLAAGCSAPGTGTPRDRLVLAVPYDVTSLDPHAEDTISNYAVLSNVYEPLVATDADMRAVPALAASWESPDPLTWVFHLQPGVFFHGGRPLTARDVVYTFHRLMTSSDLEMRSYVADVSEVVAADDHTVRLRTRSGRILLNKLAFVLIVSEGSEAATLAGTADGTGPYEVAEWSRPDSLRLVRNPRYWRGRPFFRDVVMLLAQSPDRAIAALLSGEARLVQCNTRRVETAVTDRERFEVVRRNNFYLKYLAFDAARDHTPFCPLPRNPFLGRQVRQALSAALDRSALVSRLSTYGIAATQPVPRSIFGFDPELPVPVRDTTRARDLLKAAGLTSGFPVVLHARLLFKEAALAVKDQLAEVGIDADVVVVPDPEFWRLTNRFEISFWLTRFGCPTGDASQILDDVIHTRDDTRHLGRANWARYSNPELDRAIEAAALVEPVAKRRAALQALMRRVMEELPIVPLYTDEDVYALDRALAWQPRSDSYIRIAEIGRR